MATINELLANIQNNTRLSSEVETWLGKEAFTILPDVNNAIENPLDWFNNLGVINYLKSDTGFNELPHLAKIINSFEDIEIAKVIKEVSVYFLESAYASNKTFNSYIYDDLADIANIHFARTKEDEDDIKIAQDTNLMKGFSLNFNYLFSRQFSAINTGISTTFNIQERLETLEDGHLSLLEELKTNFLDLIQNLLNAIGLFPKPKKCNEEQLIQRKQLQKQLKSVRRNHRTVDDILTGKIQQKKQNQRQYQQSNIGSSLVPITNNSGLIKATTNVLGEIAEWLLNSFLLIPLPEMLTGAISALKNMAVSLVMKVLNGEGAEALNYLISATLKTLQQYLPNIWNPTGIFAGVWNFLMSCAPYIILTAVIIILAIKFTRKVEVGRKFYIIGAETENVTNPDYLIGIYGGYNQAELLSLFPLQKDEFLTETGKNYEEIYGFSMDRTTIKTSCVLTGEVPIPLSKQEALRLWNERFSIVDDEQFFWTGVKSNIVYN